MAPRLELFPFRYRDPRTGKWIRARYRAERQEIAARYAEWEITGPAEIRNVDPNARAFSPHASFKQMMDAELRRYRKTASRNASTASIAGCSSGGRSPCGDTLPTAPGAAGLPR